MSVDAVVVNYRTPGDLEEFVGSWKEFRGRSGASLCIVNVDPTPADNDVAAAAAKMVDVQVLSFSENVGYARACNSASRLGAQDVLAFFNADVRLTSGAIDSCSEALLLEPTWGVLGPRQVDGQGRLTAAGIFGTDTQPAHRGWHHRDTGQFMDVRDDAVTVSGAAYFIRRSLWDELTWCPTYRNVSGGAEGAFLPTPHYFEETFCSFHARAHGFRCVYFGQSTIVHKWHQASAVGGYAEQQFPISQRLFRSACDAHGIPHD